MGSRPGVLEIIYRRLTAGIRERSSAQAPRFVVIGDRGSDFAAAKSVGAPCIWCAYGYGSREEFPEEGIFVIEDPVGPIPDDICRVIQG